MPTYWFGTIQDASPVLGTTIGKGYQYINQLQKIKEKNKAKTQSFGGY
jgi:hypothetical protein